MNHFINFFITILRFTHLKQNSIKIVKCTQLTGNWFNIIGSLKKIGKQIKIHGLLESEDASKKKVQANIRSNGRRAKKTARVKWARGKREANGK